MKMIHPCLIGLFTATALFTGCASGPAESFASPQEASDTLVAALKAQDQGRLKKILGSDYQELMYSGDEVADKQAISHFVTGYDQKHSFIDEGPNTKIIAVGDEGWPMAVPLVMNDTNGQWTFDPQAGREELLSRRIGHNELATIQVCMAIHDAQKEYAARDPQKLGKPSYAARLASTPGKRDGLYWPPNQSRGLVTKPPSPADISPLGSLIAQASSEGYAFSGGVKPYHGYYFRLLPAQAIPNHPSGGTVKFDQGNGYVIGFALVAYPAKYRNSGVMSFIISQRGVLYEKDLGPDTADIARNMPAYDPADGWKKVEIGQ